MCVCTILYHFIIGGFFIMHVLLIYAVVFQIQEEHQEVVRSSSYRLCQIHDVPHETISQVINTHTVVTCIILYISISLVSLPLMEPSI